MPHFGALMGIPGVIMYGVAPLDVDDLGWDGILDLDKNLGQLQHDSKHF